MYMHIYILYIYTHICNSITVHTPFRNSRGIGSCAFTSGLRALLRKSQGSYSEITGFFCGNYRALFQEKT